jgi:hypothetical protein
MRDYYYLMHALIPDVNVSSLNILDKDSILKTSQFYIHAINVQTY